MVAAFEDVPIEVWTGHLMPRLRLGDALLCSGINTTMRSMCRGRTEEGRKEMDERQVEQYELYGLPTRDTEQAVLTTVRMRKHVLFVCLPALCTSQKKSTCFQTTGFSLSSLSAQEKYLKRVNQGCTTTKNSHNNGMCACCGKASVFLSESAVKRGWKVCVDCNGGGRPLMVMEIQDRLPDVVGIVPSRLQGLQDLPMGKGAVQLRGPYDRRLVDLLLLQWGEVSEAIPLARAPSATQCSKRRHDLMNDEDYVRARARLVAELQDVSGWAQTAFLSSREVWRASADGQAAFVRNAAKLAVGQAKKLDKLDGSTLRGCEIRQMQRISGWRAPVADYSQLVEDGVLSRDLLARTAVGYAVKKIERHSEWPLSDAQREQVVGRARQLYDIEAAKNKKKRKR